MFFKNEQTAPKNEFFSVFRFEILYKQEWSSEWGPTLCIFTALFKDIKSKVG